MPVKNTDELKLHKEKFDNKGGSILGLLKGPIADTEHSTRNGRTYSRELWERVFNSPLAQEQFKNGGILGELDHPADRDEVLLSQAAVKLTEKPVEKDGLLYGTFEILNTPQGNIVYNLAKSGISLGVSSRGNGDVDPYTNEVDPTSYDFTCYDIVYIPAVEKARLTLYEGKGQKSKNRSYAQYNHFNELMKETIKNADPSNKQALREEYGKIKHNLWENLNDPVEWEAFKKENPEVNAKFDWRKYGKYFDKEGTLVDVTGFNNAVSELLTPTKLLSKDELKETPITEEETKEGITKTSKGKWVNKGKEGTHGEFKTKKAARQQQKAMFANGFKEDLEGSAPYYSDTIPEDADPEHDEKTVEYFLSYENGNCELGGEPDFNKAVDYAINYLADRPDENIVYVNKDVSHRSHSGTKYQTDEDLKECGVVKKVKWVRGKLTVLNTNKALESYSIDEVTPWATKHNIQVPDISEVSELNQPNTHTTYVIDWIGVDYEEDENSEDLGTDKYGDDFASAYKAFRYMVSNFERGEYASVNLVALIHDEKTNNILKEVSLYYADEYGWTCDIDSINDTQINESIKRKRPKGVEEKMRNIYSRKFTESRNEDNELGHSQKTSVKGAVIETRRRPRRNKALENFLYKNQKDLIKESEKDEEKPKAEEETSAEDSISTEAPNEETHDCVAEFNAKLVSFLHSYLDDKKVELGEEEEQAFVELFSSTFPDIIDFISANCEIEPDSESGEDIEPVGDAEGDDEIMIQLQGQIEENAKLRRELKGLQEEKAVINDKVNKLQEQVRFYKNSASNANKKAKQLNESIASTSKLSEKIASLRKELESLRASKSSSDKEVSSLKESLTNLKQNSVTKEELSNAKKTLQEKLDKATKQTTQYKKELEETYSKYIVLKARNIGSTPQEISNKLTEGYTVADIDKVVDDLEDTYAAYSRLPSRRNNQALRADKVHIESESRILNSYTQSQEDLERDRLQEAMIRASQNRLK